MDILYQSSQVVLEVQKRLLLEQSMVELHCADLLFPLWNCYHQVSHCFRNDDAVSTDPLSASLAGRCGREGPQQM